MVITDTRRSVAYYTFTVLVVFVALLGVFSYSLLIFVQECYNIESTGDFSYDNSVDLDSAQDIVFGIIVLLYIFFVIFCILSSRFAGKKLKAGGIKRIWLDEIPPEILGLSAGIFVYWMVYMEVIILLVRLKAAL